MPRQIEDKSKRNFLYLSAGALGAVGTAFAAWPLIYSMNPAADVPPLYGLKVDLSRIRKGHGLAVPWHGAPVFIRHRAQWEIDAAQDVDLSHLRDPQSDPERVLDPNWLVVVGVCTRQDCIVLGNKPSQHRGAFDGWFCPCCASHYDTCGRIRKGIAPSNLAIPPYDLLNETTLGLRTVPNPSAWPS